MAPCHGIMMRPRQTCSATWERTVRRHRRGFTLVEVLISVAIIGILLSIVGLAVRHLTDKSALAQAKNAVLIHAQVARSYAMNHHIETMLVVNPYNGRFEIWYLNPPAQGGSWDPLSGGDASEPEQLAATDGYMFSPILDTSARLPLDGNNRPAALVSPIDYENRAPAGPPNQQDKDNLTWAAFCFDEHGHLVIRTRRIATQTYYDPGGGLNGNANRLIDGSPDLSLMPLVDVNDTPITSTRGFVISEMTKAESVVGDWRATAASTLVEDWLKLTRPGEAYAVFAETIVLGRYSAGQLAGDF